ncbi:MAG: hypothetical protein C0622_10160 [Desulfuromonas sp.]|nr:MAG: hypothetical protein C0622_10160 [Desulfuromonas sp.]
MPKSGALFAVCYVAGLLGGIVAGLFIWGCNTWGITALLNINYVQVLGLEAFYPRMLVGGLWGLGYFFTVGTPRQRRHWIRKALWYSVIPSAFALFYLHPYVYHQGLAALDMGMLAPLLIVVSNLIWGLFTGFFTRLLWGR